MTLSTLKLKIHFNKLSGSTLFYFVLWMTWKTDLVRYIAMGPVYFIPLYGKMRFGMKISEVKGCFANF